MRRGRQAPLQSLAIGLVAVAAIASPLLHWTPAVLFPRRLTIPS